MSLMQFKLVQTGRFPVTRRVTFAEQPTWFSLASRIESLYGIPIQDVGVSYLDSEGDEITLSTHEELVDYYATMPNVHNSTIKFVVKNLGATRAQHRPTQSAPANDDYEDEEEWQGLKMPSFPGFIFQTAGKQQQQPPPPPKSPSSAFVETVDSSVSADLVAAENKSRSETASPPIIIEDIGSKEPELGTFLSVDTDDASSVSLIHSDVPDKQPVHVYQYRSTFGRSPSRGSRSHRSLSRGSPPRSPSTIASRASPIEPGLMRHRSEGSFGPRSLSLSPVPVPAEVSSPIRLRPSVSSSPSRSATPQLARSLSRSRSRSPSLNPVDRSSPKTPLSGGVKVRVLSPADPPSPVILPMPDPHHTNAAPSQSSVPSGHQTSPSLTHDIAELLSALTDAFGSHPELSEGLKNIVRNASQGVYWAAERDAMVNNALRAAESAQDNVARVAEHAQHEAGRKVAEALNGVFKALGSIVSSSVNNTQVGSRSGEMHRTPEFDGSRGRSPSPRMTSRGRSQSPVPLVAPRRHSQSPRVRSVPRARPASPYEGSGNPFPRPTTFNWYSRPGQFRPYPTMSGPFGHVHPGHVYPGYVPQRPLPPPGFGPHEGPPPPPGTLPPRSHPYVPPPPPPAATPPLGNPYPYMDSFTRRMYPPPWTVAPPSTGVRRSNTLPSRFVPPRYGGAPFDSDCQFGPPVPPTGVLPERPSSSVRKAQLEDAKQYYKEKKEEWRREKEERRKEREKRNMLRLEKRNKLKERVVHPIPEPVESDGEEASPPPIPPHPIELVNSSNSHGHRERLSTDGSVQQKTRDTNLRQELMRRLEGMGFTTKTHPRLEFLVIKHLREQPTSSKINEETVIANLLEDLFVAPIAGPSSTRSRPEERSSGVLPPGAWNV